MTRGNGKGLTSLMPTEVGNPYFTGARGGAGSDCAQARPQTVQTIAWFGMPQQAPRGLQTFLRTTLDTTQEAPLAIVDGNSSMTIRARPIRPGNSARNNDMRAHAQWPAWHS